MHLLASIRHAQVSRALLVNLIKLKTTTAKDGRYAGLGGEGKTPNRLIAVDHKGRRYAGGVICPY